MPSKPSPFPDLRRRLGEAEGRAQRFQAEGLPIPTGQLLTEFEQAVRAGDVERAEAAVKRAEALLARADQDWGWLGELLQRVDGLRGVADTVGLDLARIDARVGNPRAQLLSAPLTPTSLEKAAAGASFALAVLNDAIPKYIVAEAQSLGASIRRARDRGEDVRAAATAFTKLVRTLQEPVLAATAERLVEARHAVARIPRAPAVAAVSEAEEDEILREARNLARRLHRIKTRAHDATDAVRLITQVRQALSEDRRYASPEEEVEALWAEVDRLTKEKRLATAGPPLETEAAGPDEDVEGAPEAADEEEEEEAPEGVAAALLRERPPAADQPPSRSYVAFAPSTTLAPAAPPPRRASLLRPAPMVPPVTPLPDERVGVVPPQGPEGLANGAGPRTPRPTRIAFAAAYVPPDLTGVTTPAPTPVPIPVSTPSPVQVPTPRPVQAPVPAAVPAPPPAPAQVPAPPPTHAPAPVEASPPPPRPPPAAAPPPAPAESPEEKAEGTLLPPPTQPSRRTRSRHREA
jgi:hypothetical protein